MQCKVESSDDKDEHGHHYLLMTTQKGIKKWQNVSHVIQERAKGTVLHWQAWYAANVAEQKK